MGIGKSMENHSVSKLVLVLPQLGQAAPCFHLSRPLLLLPSFGLQSRVRFGSNDPATYAGQMGLVEDEPVKSSG